MNLPETVLYNEYILENLSNYKKGSSEYSIKHGIGSLKVKNINKVYL